MIGLFEFHRLGGVVRECRSRPYRSGGNLRLILGNADGFQASYFSIDDG
jgi:hypothetical protein